jgi:hypothetical protein
MLNVAQSCDYELGSWSMQLAQCHTFPRVFVFEFELAASLQLDSRASYHSHIESHFGQLMNPPA